MTGSKDIDNLSRLADIVYPTVHDLIDDQRIFGPPSPDTSRDV